MANKCDLDHERTTQSDMIREYAERQDLFFIGECSAKENILVKEHIEGMIGKVHEV